MSKINLIKRLSWYYPMEKMHSFLTFPAIAIYFTYNHGIIGQIDPFPSAYTKGSYFLSGGWCHPILN